MFDWSETLMSDLQTVRRPLSRIRLEDANGRRSNAFNRFTRMNEQLQQMRKIEWFLKRFKLCAIAYRKMINDS